MAKLPPSGISTPPTPQRPPPRRKTVGQMAQVGPEPREGSKVHPGKPHASPVLKSSKAVEARNTNEVTGKVRDGDDFEPSQVFGVPFREESLPVIPPNPPGGKPRSGVLELLDQAEEPGVFFREQHQDGLPDDEEESDLDAAVEEAIRLLFGVRGIHHIGPGEDGEGLPVVLISANTGFSAASLERVPREVLGFKTLLALPYELLPLRRERT